MRKETFHAALFKNYSPKMCTKSSFHSPEIHLHRSLRRMSHQIYHHRQQQRMSNLISYPIRYLKEKLKGKLQGIICLFTYVNNIYSSQNKISSKRNHW